MVQIRLNNGKTFDVTWEDSGRTVKELRQTISAKLDGISLDEAKMVHRGQVMNDEFPTSKYGITENSIIFVVVKNLKQAAPAPQPTVTEEDSDKEEPVKSASQPSNSNPFQQMPQSPFGGLPNFSSMFSGGAGGMDNMFGNMSQLMNNPEIAKLYSNPKFMNLTARLMSDPLVSGCIMSGDPLAMARPDILQRFQEIVNEEMPEFYSIMSNGMMNGGGFPSFPGMNPGMFSQLYRPGSQASSCPSCPSCPSARPTGLPSPGQNTTSKRTSKNDESDDQSDDIMDEFYKKDSTECGPCNSQGQKDAINEFIKKMIASDENKTGPSNEEKTQSSTEEPKRAEPTQEELREKYKSQLETLHSMGFFDDARALNLLNLTGGDINATVDRMLNEM